MILFLHDHFDSLKSKKTIHHYPVCSREHHFEEVMKLFLCDHFDLPTSKKTILHVLVS